MLSEDSCEMPGGLYFIGTGTSHYKHGDFADRPELSVELARMSSLFSDVLGYSEVADFGLNMSSIELKARLRAFLTADERRRDDRVVFYYTGHAIHDGMEYLIPLRETTNVDLIGTSLSASELSRWLFRGTAVDSILVILDTCYAGAGGGEIAKKAIDQMLHERRSGGSAVISASRPYEAAESGAFTQAFESVVRHRASGGHNPRFLALDGVVNMICEETPTWQNARLFLTGDPVTEFLPNPRYDPSYRDLDLRAQRDRQQRALREAESKAHVLPRAQGLDTPQDDLWLFTGRGAALKAIGGWLQQDEGHRTLVVTGDPGSGKSSVLSRVFVLSDPKLRARVPALYRIADETLPPVGSIARFIHARGLTASQIFDGILEAARLGRVETPADLLAAVAARTEPLTIVIDAVDESIGGNDLRTSPVAHLLVQLIEGAPRSKLRLLIGSRRPLLSVINTDLCVLADLDKAEYSEPGDINSYAVECLMRLSPASPYRHVPESVTREVADGIARAAQRSFLVALIVGRSLSLREAAVDPTVAGWDARLPREASEAMRLDLDERLGVEAAKARDLLRPLAYAQGAGLPWEDIWPRLASELGAARYTSDDIDWLVERAGYYVIETTEQKRSTYRLYHESLEAHLRADRDAVVDHQRIVMTLRDHALAGGSGNTWFDAHPYIRTHLATHASRCQAIDGLALDPAFLLASHRPQMLAALSRVATPDAKAAADAFIQALPHLRGKHHTEHGSYLQMAAAQIDASVLLEASQRADVPAKWSTLWADWQPERTHQRIGTLRKSTRQLATVQVDGMSILVAGAGYSEHDVWDVATGKPMVSHRVGHTYSITAAEFVTIGGKLHVMTGGSDGSICVRAVKSGEPILPPSRKNRGGVPGFLSKMRGDSNFFKSHDNAVNEIFGAQYGGQSLAISGDAYGKVCLWDLDKMTVVENVRFRHHRSRESTAVNAVKLAQVAGALCGIVALADGTVRLWPPAAKESVLFQHGDAIEAMALCHLGGRAVVVTGSGSEIQVHDAASGAMTAQFSIPGTRIMSLDVGPTNQPRVAVVAGTSTGSVYILDIENGQELLPPFRHGGNAVYAVRYTAVDERDAVISADEHGVLRLWDITHAGPQQSAGSSRRSVSNAVALTVDDRPITVSSRGDSYVEVVESRTGHSLTRPFTASYGSTMSLAGIRDSGTPGHNYIATLGTMGISVASLDTDLYVTQRFQARFFRAHNVRNVLEISFARSREGEALLLVTPSGIGILDVVGRRWLRRLRPEGAGIRLTATTGSGETNYVAAAGDDALIDVWSTATWRHAACCAMKGPTSALGFFQSRTECYLVAGNANGEVKFWNLRHPYFLRLMRLARLSRLNPQHVIKLDGRIRAIANCRATSRLYIAHGQMVRVLGLTSKLDIDVGSPVTALTPTEANHLMVATENGLIVLRIDQMDSATPLFSRWSPH
ncbi:hypothetical protein AB0B66_37130 [Catellatospora sp. NPDC049111]|uniref:hypothetical protein n=1 Tax=Catellatospora sp. NPDC049111 TaxID=3155271 RepID=UPI0034002CE2